MGDMLFQDDDKVVQVAMQIVIAAGDAEKCSRTGIRLRRTV